MSHRQERFLQSVGLLFISGLLGMLWLPLGIVAGLGTIAFFIYGVILGN